MQLGASLKKSDNLDLLSSLRDKVDETFWKSVLTTPVTQLPSKLESAQQESFRCQHEMLEQISLNQRDFVTGISLGVDYITKQDQQQRRVSGIASLQTSFSKGISREEFIRLGSRATVKKDSLSEESRWQKLLTQTPKKLEDLEEISHLVKRVSQINKGDSRDEASILRNNTKLLQEYAGSISKKYLPVCLSKSLASVPVALSNPEQSLPELKAITNTVGKLADTPDRFDQLFSLLVHKTCKNTIGQSQEGRLTSNQLRPVYESLVSSCDFALGVLARHTPAHTDTTPANASRQDRDNANHIVLHPHVVKNLRDRTAHLYSSLAKEGKLMPCIGTVPFLPVSLQQQILEKTFTEQVTGLLSVAGTVHTERFLDEQKESTLIRIRQYLALLSRQFSQAMGEGYLGVLERYRSKLDDLQTSPLPFDWYSLCLENRQNPVQTEEPELPEEEQTHFILGEEDEQD